jgi:hypothetical protein
LRKYNLRLLDDAWWQEDLINQYQGDPLILAWSIADEPEAHECAPMSLVDPMNSSYRKNDSKNPVAQVYCPWPGYPAQEYNFTDLVLVDHYPIAGHPPTSIEPVVDECWRAARPKPIWFVAQAFQWPESRFPTPEEERLMVYGALAHRAKGIFYWAYHISQEPYWGAPLTAKTPDHKHHRQAKVLWEDLRDLNRELSLISDLVVTSDVVPIAKVDNPQVEVAALLSEENIVLIILNQNFQFRAEEFSFNSLKDLELEVLLPEWFNPTEVFSVSASMIKSEKYQLEAGKLKVRLEDLPIAKVVVLTTQKGLADNIRGRMNQ